MQGKGFEAPSDSKVLNDRHFPDRLGRREEWAMNSEFLEAPPQRRRWLPILVVLTIIHVAVLGYGGALVYLKFAAPDILRRATLALAANRPADVRQRLAWLTWAQPQHPAALILIGRSFMAEERYMEAVEVLDQVKHPSAEFEVASATAAMAELAQGAVESSEQRMVRHLEQFPEDHAVRGELRWLYFNQLRTRDVERLLEDQLRRFPDQWSAAEDLLSSEFRRQLPRDGMPYLQELDKKVPRQATVKMALATCYWQLGKTDEARLHFQAAFQSRPHEPWMKQVFALFLFEQGCSAEEVRPYLAQPPRDDLDWYQLCLLNDLEGDTPQAIKAIQQALQLRPKEAAYVTRMADLQQQAGRIEEANAARKLARDLGDVNSQLNEIVLSDQHLRPTPPICRRIASLNAARGRSIQAAVWSNRATFLETEASH